MKKSVSPRARKPWRGILGLVLGIVAARGLARAEDPAPPEWKYRSELLRPFWQGDTIEGESVLFIRDPSTGAGSASLLFPARRVLAVRNSAGDVTYEEGRDYVVQPDSREIILTAGSRIVSRTPRELRRPAKSQKYALTHRDGDGEILFGAGLEYHDMQACVTYTHAPGLWKTSIPEFAEKQLSRTIARLRDRKPLTIVVLGDSISAGCNASGWAAGAPYQPPYDGLLKRHLEAHYHGAVDLKNLAVGGTDTRWALAMVDKVVEARPDLVLLAFGMNDSAGRPAAEYKSNIENTLVKIRAERPEAEFILVAPMLGNRDWVRLHPELFPQYRDALADLCGPGIALADLTSVWTAFLERKRDWDLTGNGVNHPNDFGHRVYAQVISALLVPSAP
jgi:lysophospholipase L1-like esterase